MGPSGKMILMLCLAGFAYSASAVDHQVYTLAGIDRNSFRCEELSSHHCAFAVSSSGARCVLETNVLKNGEVELECQSSNVVTNKFSSWIESPSCINACGLNHMSVGLSTDFLGEKELQRSICASSCIDVCSNIEELFTMLAGGEGVRLRTLCDAYKPEPVVATVDETTNETASFDDEAAITATEGTAADAEATSTTTDTSSATVVPTPRKLIQATVTYADAPAAAYAWTADRRMLYNLAPAPAVVPVPLSATASSPVYANAPVAPAAAADAPSAAAPVSVTGVPAVATAPVVPAAAPAPVSVAAVVEAPATASAPDSAPAFGNNVAVPAPAPSSV